MRGVSLALCCTHRIASVRACRHLVSWAQPSGAAPTPEHEQQLASAAWQPWQPPGPAGARVLDGRAAAAEWAAALQHEAASITRRTRRPPGLAVVLVGSRPDSLLYTARKREACERAGVACRLVHLPADTRQQALQAQLRRLCADPAVDGVLVQLPLPPGLDEEAVMSSLDPRKDVDGFHPLNMGRMLMRGRVPRFVPATPLGVMELLQRSGVSVAGKAAVCLGDSNVVGTPLSVLLRNAGAAAVTVCHRTSYSEYFSSSQEQRAEARACLPCLPGPRVQEAPALATPTAHAPGEGGSSEAGSSSWRSSNSGSQDSCSDRGSSGCCEAGSESSSRSSSGVCGGGGGRGERGGGGSGGDGGGCGFQAHQLPHITRTADVLVVAVGHPGLVRASWVKPGAVVIDVGINVVPAGDDGSDGGGCLWQKQDWSAATFETSSSFSGSFLAAGSDGQQCGYRVVGDVAAGEVARVASAITPVPGGVGPMTIAAVLHNTLQAAGYHAGLTPW